jgi:hypothetical protein
VKHGIKRQVKSLIVADRKSPEVKQGGIALLFLVVAIALTISAYYFSKVSIVEIQAGNLHKTRVALKQAKQALLGHAAVRSDLTDPSAQAGRYGFLPCPANNNGEGNSVGTCESAKENTLGWFPWRSLQVAPVKDGNEDCLLYAVSGSYKFSPPTDMLNEDTNGMFQVVNEQNLSLSGVSPEDRVVAVIFSAGGALPGQSRAYELGSDCGNDIDNYSAYLDSFEVAPGDVVDNSAVVTGNEDEVYRFVQANIAVNKGVFNDQLITITRDEVWSSIISRSDFNEKMTRLTEALALCLDKYAAANANAQLPWPAPMGLADYRSEDLYDDTDGMAGYLGRFPFRVNDSNGEIGIAGSIELFTAADCDNLGPDSIDLKTDGADGYRKLYDNWKDHFFYAVSKDYAPDTLVPGCVSDCITVESSGPPYAIPPLKRAAVVIYSGSRVAGQTRNELPDVSTKNLITNYIENGSWDIIPDMSGSAAYVTDGGNEIMYCIQDGLGTVSC